MTKEYDRAGYLKDWAEKILKCENNEFAIAAALITQNRNFQTAVAVLFGLSFTTHKDYIIACAEYWQKNCPIGSIADVAYVTAFQKHYTEEVVPYPEDA